MVCNVYKNQTKANIPEQDKTKSSTKSANVFITWAIISAP